MYVQILILLPLLCSSNKCHCVSLQSSPDIKARKHWWKRKIKHNLPQFLNAGVFSASIFYYILDAILLFFDRNKKLKKVLATHPYDINTCNCFSLVLDFTRNFRIKGRGCGSLELQVKTVQSTQLQAWARKKQVGSHQLLTAPIKSVWSSRSPAEASAEALN